MRIGILAVGAAGALLLSVTASAAPLDPSYTKKYGYGVVIASKGGFPAKDKHDPSQIDFRDGKFFVPGGEETTLDLRVILPKGMTLSKLLAKTKKEHKGNLKFLTEEIYTFRIWASHTYGGEGQVTGRHQWPTKLSDVPLWASPEMEAVFNLSTESKTWDTVGAVWADDLKAGLRTLLSRAKPGYKLYVIFSVGYKYKVPGGQMESKWDDVWHKFVQVKSTGMLGFARGMPVAACTIEIAGAAEEKDRFTDNGNGTVTDKKTGLVWAKSASTKKSFQEAEPYLKGLTLAGKKGWRLPTIDELKDLRKAGGEQPFQWFNSHGFSGVQSEFYWSSTIHVSDQVWGLDMDKQGEKGTVQMSDQGCVWPMRKP